MKTIAILFALTVVAAAAPTVASGRDHLVPALLSFTAALAALTLGCLAAGWRAYELRAHARVTHAPAAARDPERVTLISLATALRVDDPGVAARDTRLSALRAWSSPPLGEGYPSARISGEAPVLRAAPAGGPGQHRPRRPRAPAGRS